ncbi:hypothetical protein JGI22_00321 [Candidatus Kryptobacter tengchongensis]|nr:hypothetical protein JGI22_00321 [Candidatus Kryptobacter tengchongensis]
MRRFLYFAIFLFAVSQTSAQLRNERCFVCHGVKNFGIVEHGKFKSLYVSKEDFEASVHSKFACVSCHVDVRVIPHLTKPVFTLLNIIKPPKLRFFF